MSDEIWARDEVESPCVRICMIHPESRLCLGCGRSVDEISRWSRMSSEERREIMAELPSRSAGPKRRSGGADARRAMRRSR
jgi:predicted Fe-S protein YdhL (DUF1289 family)